MGGMGGGSGGQIAMNGSIGFQPEHGVSEYFRILGIDKACGIATDLREAGIPATKHWHLLLHRFKDWQTEAFMMGREDQCEGVTVFMQEVRF